MLIINTDLWSDYRIVKVNSSSRLNWNKPDSAVITGCILNQIKVYLTEVIERKEKMILIIDLSKGIFPPWMQALTIAKFFVSLKTLLIKGLAFTIIYAITNDQKTWISRILMLYTPARPVHIVESKDEIRQKINEHIELTDLSISDK